MEKIKRENKLLLDKLSIDLVVDTDDVNLLKISKTFLRELDDSYKKFIDILDGTQKKINKDLLKFFTPEKLSRKSPITLIDAPWGSGKTYFIETFAKHFLLKDKNNQCQLSSKHFDDLIIIDVWKFSNSLSIPDEIMSEIFYKLANKSNGINKEKIIKLASRLYNTTLRSWLNNGLKLDLDKIDLKKEKSKEEIIEEAVKYLPKTIIFLDNIERLGNNSWDVIKAIMKLCQIESFVLILPMNVNWLKYHDKSADSEEMFIEKIIDIPYFKFRQNYLNMLKKTEFGFSDDVSHNLNEILESDIKGHNLSIRGAESLITKNNIYKIKNKYEIYSTFYDKVWGNIDAMTDILFDEILKSNVFDFIVEHYNNFEEIKKTENEISNLLEGQKFIDFSLPYIEGKWEINFSFYEEVEIFYKEVLECVELLNNAKNELETNLNKEEEKENNNRKKIELIDKKIIKCNNIIKKEVNKGSGDKTITNQTIVLIQNNAIDKYNEDIGACNNNISLIVGEIEELENDISDVDNCIEELENMSDELNNSLKKLEINYEKYKKDEFKKLIISLEKLNNSVSIIDILLAENYSEIKSDLIDLLLNK